MFKPIKDFITFIQKNTSNSNAEEEVSTMENPSEVNNSVIPAHTAQVDDANVTVEKNALVAVNENLTPELDDIEAQIKPIMINKPLTRPTTPESPTVATTSLSSSFKTPPLADHNHNNQPKLTSILPEEDDELADFKNDPMQNSAEDYCSVGSEIEDLPLQSADEAGDELATEDEDALEERSYSEIENENKLFVAVDADLNSSIASSNPEDPLAIDINALSTEADIIINPLDSSTTDEKIEVASNGDIVWYETVDLEQAESTLNISKNAANAANVQTKPPRIIEHQKRAGEESNEETERNDNSDSGLGTETSSLLLQTTIDNSITESTASYADEDQCNGHYEKPSSSCEVDGRTSIGSSSSSTLIFAAANHGNAEIKTVTTTIISAAAPALRSCTPAARKPLRSNLKRRHSDVDNALGVADGSTANVLSAAQDAFQPKKPKRSITFDAVHVYYFPRQQGFGCVPSAGGCTLGMGAQHIDSRRLTLAEHAAELRRAHRLQLQEINPRGSSSEDTDESEEDYLSEGSGSDLDADSNGFLQPVPPKQRRALLKAAGVRKIDTSEKIDCRNIRNSREVCGCTCRDFCDPETCTCSRAGIKCQVDRAMFPCGCSRDACGNTTGRVEFNPARVRTHFIHTIMRLDMENRQQQPASMGGYDATTGLLMPHVTNNGVVPAANYYNSIQPQSNYSSGYASPAYTNDASASYLQQQNLLYPNHHGGDTVASANSAEQYHSLDSIDGGNLYATTSTTTPSYGEILPHYGATPSQPYNHSAQSLNFPTSSYVSSYQPQQQEHHAPTNYLTRSPISTTNDTNLLGHSGYSSCAVPSRPPYGTATTCSSTLSTTSSNTTSDTNFISLNTPIASSSRLSQINDLLQHNRNTTAALVAVSTNNNNNNNTNNYAPTTVNVTNNQSIETPPLNESQKACFVFDADLGLAGTVSNNKPFPRLLSPTPPQSEPPPDVPINDSFYSHNGGSTGGCNYPI